VGWWEVIKAALVSIPKLLDEFKALREEIARAAAAAENRRLQEVRDAQNKLEIEILRLKNDEERAGLLRRIHELERQL
jgi:hypothetical protein